MENAVTTSASARARLVASFPTVVRGVDIVSQLARRRGVLKALCVIACVAGLLSVATYYSAENRALRRIVELDGVTAGVMRSSIVPSQWKDVPLIRLVHRMTQKKKVQGVSVAGKPVTDDDVALFITAFPDCRSLTLSSTQITDASLVHIGVHASGLYVLRASDTAVTDAGIPAIVEMQELYDVALDRTQITDATMAKLSKLPRLIQLNVARTQITDAGFAHLVHVPQLDYLDVSQTAVTDAAIAKFEKSKPHCRVTH